MNSESLKKDVRIKNALLVGMLVFNLAAVMYLCT